METTAKRALPLTKLIKEFNLETIFTPEDIDKVVITRSEINRPGLPLTGFFDILTQKEFTFLVVLKFFICLSCPTRSAIKEFALCLKRSPFV